ncbi:MAG: hypothetical protein WA580_08335 [Acidimicrobiales bacterium]
MTPDPNLDDILRSLDPLSEDIHRENMGHRDAVWARILTGVTPRRTRARRSVISLGALGIVGASAALIVGLLPNATPVRAAAATTLHRAALDDATAAALPALSTGQYYYQEALITLTCSFAADTSSGQGPWITYIADATMQSWTAPNETGQLLITPTPINQDGSHFATPADEANWATEGDPLIPCSFQTPPLPSAPTSSPAMQPVVGPSETVEPFDGFGFMVRAQPGGTPPNQAVTTRGSPNNILTLPDNVSQIESMLANGEINPDASVSTTPQACPMDAATGAAPGCNSDQQLTLIEQLLRLPEASAKLGSVLYQVLEQMPGATVVANTTDGFGNTGTALTVPVGGSANATDEFQVLIEPTTGVLLSSSELSDANVNGSTNATYAPRAGLSYGPIDVVSGVGTLPTPTS